MRSLILLLAIVISVLALACGSVNGDAVFDGDESFSTSKNGDMGFALDTPDEMSVAASASAPPAMAAAPVPEGAYPRDGRNADSQFLRLPNGW